jgi:hypothetical protein
MYKFLFSIFFLLSVHLVSAQIKQYEPANNEADYNASYEERIKKERLMGRYIPKDLNDAFVVLNNMLEEKDRAKFAQMSEKDALHKLYFSFHRWIIVNWGLEGGSRFSHYIKGMGLSHPEDMASLVVIAYHRKLNNKDLGIKDLATNLKEERKKIFEASRKRTILSEEIKKKN